MSEIAFNRRDGSATRILAPMLLVAAGLTAGFSLARLAPAADIGATAPQQGASEWLSANVAFQAQRAGERATGSAASLSNPTKASQVERPVRHVGDAGP